MQGIEAPPRRVTPAATRPYSTTKPAPNGRCVVQLETPSADIPSAIGPTADGPDADDPPPPPGPIRDTSERRQPS